MECFKAFYLNIKLEIQFFVYEKIPLYDSKKIGNFIFWNIMLWIPKYNRTSLSNGTWLTWLLTNLVSKLNTYNWPHPQTSLSAYYALREDAIREVLLYLGYLQFIKESPRIGIYYYMHSFHYSPKYNGFKSNTWL